MNEPSHGVKTDELPIVRTYASNCATRDANAQAPGAIEIRYNGNAFITSAIIAAVLAIIFIWVGLRNSPTSWLAIAGGLLALVYVAFRSRTFLNPTPIVILDADGIKDRRLRFPLIPWSEIDRAEDDTTYFSLLSRTPHIGITLQIKDTPEGSGPDLPSKIYIDLASLDTNPGKFVEHVRRFAPQVPAD